VDSPCPKSVESAVDVSPAQHEIIILIRLPECNRRQLWQCKPSVLEGPGIPSKSLPPQMTLPAARANAESLMRCVCKQGLLLLVCTAAAAAVALPKGCFRKLLRAISRMSLLRTAGFADSDSTKRHAINPKPYLRTPSPHLVTRCSALMKAAVRSGTCFFCATSHSPANACAWRTKPWVRLVLNPKRRWKLAETSSRRSGRTAAGERTLPNGAPRS